MVERSDTMAKVNNFRFWCQKVLPLVYDDSLSYYELLCKVVEYLNNVIQAVNENTDDVANMRTELTEFETAIHTEVSDFKTYVNGKVEELETYMNNYFNNLDVQTEINNKLDTMANDGTLSAIVEPYLEAFTQNIDLQVETITQAISVLSARMDTFSHLSEGSTTGDAELADIRVGENGVTYNNAGDAVRANDALKFTLRGIIDTNEDLNNYGYNKCGFYIVLSNRVLTNAPASNCTGCFIILPASNTNTALMVQQIFVDYTNNNSYIRVKDNNTTVWTSWKNMKDQPVTYNFKELGYIDNNTDLNNCIRQGFFTVLPNRTLTNAPTDYAGHNSLLIVYPTVSNSSVAQITQLFFDFTTQKSYIRVRPANSAFTTWRSINKYILNGSDIGSLFEATNFTSNVSGNNYGDSYDIMCYNVAHYSNQTGVKIGDSAKANALLAFKKLVQYINPTFAFICEDTEYIDTANTKTADGVIYNHILPNTSGIEETTIKSKIGFDGIYSDDVSESRTCNYVIFNNLNGKKICLYVAHLSPTSGGEALRLSELNHIFSTINGISELDAFIIAGDFNLLTATDRSNFISVCESNNCKYGNGSWLGWLNTHNTSLPLDNVIVSDNVFINRFEVLDNWYDNLFSDHYPVRINVTITD